MRLYIAGLYTTHMSRTETSYSRLTENQRQLRDAVSWYLESYHYIHKGKYVERIRRDGTKVFLDSGAFSAFSLGVEVDISAYATFVREHQDIIDMASVLDAIGDPEGTYRNQKELERLGVEVLPCFHFGEPLDLCEHYVSNYPYITLGGMVPIPNAKLEPWLDEVWDKVLTDRDGYARCKVHGFGMTSRPLMLKYPWFSVDSSSWVQLAARGNISLPEIPVPISISDRAPTRHDWGRHYTTLPEHAKRYVTALLEYYGLTADEVQQGHLPRWALNCFTFDRLGKLLGDDHWRRPFHAKQGVLF